MIATVAVGTDGSETAAKALEAAYDLAERYAAKLVIISAFRTPAKHTAGVRLAGAASANPEWEANEVQQVERILADAEESAAERGIQCSPAMAPGDPGEVLVSLAEQHGADLLVVGNKGMDRRILGSVPNTVTHKATCSVFVVKTSLQDVARCPGAAGHATVTFDDALARAAERCGFETV